MALKLLHRVLENALTLTVWLRVLRSCPSHRFPTDLIHTPTRAFNSGRTLYLHKAPVHLTFWNENSQVRCRQRLHGGGHVNTQGSSSWEHTPSSASTNAALFHSCTITVRLTPDCTLVSVSTPLIRSGAFARFERGERAEWW